MLRGELMRVFRAEYQKAGQATCTMIKTQTSFRTQIGGAVAVDARAVVDGLHQRDGLLGDLLERPVRVRAALPRARLLREERHALLRREGRDIGGDLGLEHPVARVQRDDPARLAELRAAGLTRLYIGPETGDDLTAKRIAKERLLELELQLADAPDDLIDTDASLREATAARETWQRAVAELAAVRERVARFGDVRAAIERLNQDGEQRRERHRMLVRLADTLAGRAPNTMRMTLETFVLAAELEEIVAAANLRLADMSDGRYRLEHTDALARRGAASGLGLQVHDAYTGRSRPPQSLSGGETFLASLALALGLAEVVTSRAGGIRLDTLFIDEGFGSLDAETLELALRTLDDLRSGGRTIGVISHV